MENQCRPVSIRAFLKSEWRWLLPLAVISVLVFLPSLHYPFLIEWDDGGFVVQNPRLYPSWQNIRYWLAYPTQGVFTPATMYSLMLDYWWFGLDPAAFRLHNMLLHALAAVLLYANIRHFDVNRWIAFGATLLWSVHPQRVESVVWISERKDVLAGVFAFAAILLFMRAFDRERFSPCAILFLVAAYGAKPSTLTLPAIMAAYVVYRAVCKTSGEPRWKRSLAASFSLWPAALVTIGFYLWFYLVSHDALDKIVESWPRLWLVPLHNAIWYLLTAVFPFELNPIYPRIGLELRAWLVIGGGAAALAGAVAIFCLMSQRPIRWFSLVLFAVAWASCWMPVSGFLWRFTNTDYCDRYNYLPAAVLWFGIAVAAQKIVSDNGANIFKVKTCLGLIAGLAAGVYVAMTLCYLPFWSDSGILFMRAADDVRFPNIKAIEGLGLAGGNRNNSEMMAAAGRLFLQRASENQEVPLPPDMKNAVADYHAGIFFTGQALFAEGRFAEAAASLEILADAFHERRLRLYDAEIYLPRLWSMLAASALATGQRDEAEKYLKLQLTALPPTDAEAFFCRGLLAFLAGDVDEAVSQWRQAALLRPDDARIRHNLRRAEALLEQQRQ